jgi:light-regulated signal transduction histidine kinase (bacteriophytochrome)
MGFKGVYCENLKHKDIQDASSARRVLYNKRKSDLINELVDPICVISNANEILSKRLSKFVDSETRSYFEMIARATTKTKTLIEELRNENNPIE